MGEAVETLCLDTHVVVWLFAAQTQKLSPKAAEYIEKYDLTVSPMVSLELRYLYEIGRIRCDKSQILAELQSTIGLEVDEAPFARVVERSLTLGWCRDPFDRLIVAHAIYRDAMLLTRDKNILSHCKRAVW